MLMNKFLRYSFVALMAMVFGNSYAAEGTSFLFDQNYSTLFPTLKGTSSNESHDGDFTEATTSTSVDGFTVTVSAADEGASAANRIWQNSPRLRMYSGTLTVKGKGIKQIVFTINGTKKFDLTPSTGTLTDMVWKGETDEVVFTVGGTTQLSSLIINGDYDPSTPEVPTAANIEALNALANNTAFTFTGEAQVVYLNGRYAYIKDATGSSLIYDSSTSKLANLAIGKKIAANWTGKVSIYNNLFEAVPDAVLAVTEDAPVEVTYPEVAIADVVATNMNQVVVLKGVTYTAPDGKNFTISKGGVDVNGYNQFGLEIAAPEAEKSYDITGVISVYKTNVQFQPIKIEEATQGGGSSTTFSWEGAEGGATVSGGTAVASDGESVNFLNTVNSVSYYTIRLNGAADFSTNIVTINLDKAISAGDKLVVTGYRNKNAADKQSGLLAKFNNGGEVNSAVTGLEFVNLNPDHGGDSNPGTTPNTLSFDIPAEAVGSNKIELTRAKTQTNLFITKLEITSGSTGINTVKTVRIADGAIYNLAGQKVDKSYKGVVIMNGKKMIQK